MNAPNSACAQFGSSRLERFKAALRSLNECVGRVNRVDVPQLMRNRKVKGYKKGEGCVIFEAWSRSSPSRKHYLVLHRVPLGPKNRKFVESGTRADGPESKTGNITADGCSDRVFLVSERRHGPNKGVSALVRVVSWVWLLSFEDVPKFVRDRLFSGLATLQLPLEQSLLVDPRVVAGAALPTNGIAGGDEHLVEAVFGVVDGVRDPLFNDVRCAGFDDNLSDEVFRLSVALYDGGEIVWMDEGAKSTISIGASTYRSVDELLGLLEC
jgi:hypothetical protein